MYRIINECGEARKIARENAYMDDGTPVAIRAFDFIELTKGESNV